MGTFKLGDNVLGSPFPGTIHDLKTWTIDGVEYERVGNAPPKCTCNVTYPSGTVTVYTFVSPGGETIQVITVTVDGSGNLTKVEFSS